MAVNVSLLLAEKLTIYANISRYQPAPNMAVPAPRLYGQCPRCGSLLEVDQFGCLMIDGLVESCATRVCPGMVHHVRVGEEVFVHQAGIKRKLK